MHSNKSKLEKWKLILSFFERPGLVIVIGPMLDDIPVCKPTLDFARSSATFKESSH